MPGEACRPREKSTSIACPGRCRTDSRPRRGARHRPAPLLYSSGAADGGLGYLGASAALAVCAAVVLRLGWGDVESPFALHGVKLLAVDIALFAGAAYGVVHAMGLLRALDSLPWRAGQYLFPGCVVDASGPVLDVWSVGDAEAVERSRRPGPGLALRMRDGSRVVVPAASAEQAEKADAALGSLRQELARAIAEDDPHVLAELDPAPRQRACRAPSGRPAR